MKIKDLSGNNSLLFFSKKILIKRDTSINTCLDVLHRAFSTFYLSAKCCWLTTVIRSDFRLMGISMFTRQSQAGKSAAVRVHPYFTFTFGLSWVHSGSLRFFQVWWVSQCLRGRAKLASQQQSGSIHKMCLLWVYFAFILWLFWFDKV